MKGRERLGMEREENNKNIYVALKIKQVRQKHSVYI
jgi:hypothetical protein